ncbi:MAG TPA: DMT family transporter [Gemmatimonadales bacterium]|nr:DMT family transporter [Gemmatimonadales bacterium]
MSSSEARRADLRLAFATLLWAASFVVVKQGLTVSSPLAFTAARFAIGALVLTPFARLGQRFTSGELLAGALVGGLLAVGFATQTVGLVYTTPARSAFIVASSSILAPIVAFVAAREPLRANLIVALALASVGMYLITNPETGGLNRGDVWTLVTALCFGAQIAAVTQVSRRYDPLRLVWMETVITAAGAGVAALLTEKVTVIPGCMLAATLAYTGVCATALALLWQTRAQRHMSSARAALIFCLEPVFAAAISWGSLGERLSLLQWAGGGLIVVGMLVPEIGASAGRAELTR